MFSDRREAGRDLAYVLMPRYGNRDDVVVLGLPRGGVILAREVADRLRAPLDILVVRKLGSPLNPEYAIGALAETGRTLWNEQERIALSDEIRHGLVERERKEAQRRALLYRSGRAVPDLQEKIVLLVDDGVATGATMRVAILAARDLGASKVVVAVPHGAYETLVTLRELADDVVALLEPVFYGSVGAFYREFSQVTDEEVLACLGS